MENNITHSSLGIASLVISLFAAASLFLAWLAGMVVEMRAGASNTGDVVIVGFLTVVGILSIASAIGLGIAGISQKNRKHALAVSGVTISGITVFVYVALLLISHM